MIDKPAELDYQEFVIDDGLKSMGDNVGELLAISDEEHVAAMEKLSTKDQEAYRLGLEMFRSQFA